MLWVGAVFGTSHQQKQRYLIRRQRDKLSFADLFYLDRRFGERHCPTAYQISRRCRGFNIQLCDCENPRGITMSRSSDSSVNRSPSWWRHQMETFSALLALCAENSPVPDEFLTQRLVTQSFDVFFDLRLNKRLSKQSWGWWFEMLSRSLWCHCNVDFSVRDPRGAVFNTVWHAAVIWCLTKPPLKLSMDAWEVITNSFTWVWLFIAWWRHLIGTFPPEL